MTGYQYVGGITGYMINSVVNDVKMYGKITTNSNSNYFGGVAGYAFNSEIKNSEVWGDVTGYKYVGGIAGYALADTGKAVLIENGMVYGSITATSTNSGGAVGTLGGTNATVRNVYLNGNKVQIPSGGGLFVYAKSSASKIENSGYYITGQVEPADAAILINDAVYSENRIERSENGSFSVMIPVSSASGTTTVTNNNITSIAFTADGYAMEKVYLSENNANCIE